MRRYSLVKSCVLVCFFAPSVHAQDMDLGAEKVGSLAFGVGYNMDAGASVSGRFRHDRFLGYDQTLDFGFDVSEDEHSYDLLFQNNGIGNGNPKFAFVLSHVTSDRQSLMGIDTTETFFRPQAVFTNPKSRLTVEAIFGHDEISNVAAAPAVLQAEEGARDLYGLGLDYSAKRAGWSYGISGEAITDGRDLSYGKLETTASYEIAFPKSETEVGVRLAAGMISVWEGQTTVNDRFLPSSGALRGFEAGGFGPADASVLDGAPVGATNYAVMSFYARRTGVIASMPELAIGGFVDLGSAWGFDDNGNAARAAIDDGANLRASIGLTVSREFGPARVELVLAHPFQHEDTDHLQEVQINFTSKF
ncbi:surface antigen-like protein [Rhodobacter sp. JA431]|nr:surface antigen-like protein [Rhodobacter sp. JA431]